VIVATHSDQALNLLQDPSPQEQEVLGAIRYQENDTVLHTDSSLLPTRRQAWAGWNYHIVPQSRQRTTITYNMNILQGIQAPQTFCVTLNRTSEIDPDSILRRMTYHHPVYTADTLRAQRLHHSITGHNRTHYCGAYWGYGFHEDGVNSALQVCRAFGATLA
jgi:predicted NAD/FAD-binding protein